MLTLVVQARVLKFGPYILQIITDITIQGLSTDRVKEHFFKKAVYNFSILNFPFDANTSYALKILDFCKQEIAYFHSPSEMLILGFHGFTQETQW